jgi:ecdysone 20-monooxygenase
MPFDISTSSRDFVQAGQETSSNSLSFTLYLLAKHPDVADKVYAEVVGVCGTSGPVTWDHVHELR